MANPFVTQCTLKVVAQSISTRILFKLVLWNTTLS